MRDVVLPKMRACGVTRIMVLSTPTAINSVQEVRGMSWKWWLYTWLPVVAAPEGNAEMRGIARVVSGGVLGAGMMGEVVDAARKRVGDGVEWTVFRVPGLVDGDKGGRDVVRVGMFGAGFDGGLTLTRQSLVRWILGEVEDRGWVGGWPVVANA